MTMIKRLYRTVLAAAMALCLALSAAAGVRAADYNFEGVSESGYYPSTDYEDVYDAQYNYGGMNTVDFMNAATSPYGCTDGTSIGAAERVTLPGTGFSAGSYGVLFNEEIQIAPVVYDAAVTPYVYQATAYTGIDGMVLPDGSIGTVEIPSLKITVKVWEGESTESMAKGLGHYSMSSCWDGNVCVCGHNRGAKCAIGPIKDLNIGDTITLTTVYGTRTYSVSYVGTISYTDWSHLQATSDNRITLTTCLANQPEYRVCVQAVEAR